MEPQKKRVVCSACKGDGDGGRDSEGFTIPCQICGGSGAIEIIVRRDPILFREVAQ